jgi:hypothetical protein
MVAGKRIRSGLSRAPSRGRKNFDALVGLLCPRRGIASRLSGGIAMVNSPKIAGCFNSEFAEIASGHGEN